ncbi:flagellar hook-length control protein FliK [Tabrizicola sp.]|uniref:flagellar hook-length control protein FliK n=1 Tax=Tabrizicola sp. TaxID=2005166 RepID=UPI003F417CCF
MQSVLAILPFSPFPAEAQAAAEPAPGDGFMMSFGEVPVDVAEGVGLLSDAIAPSLVAPAFWALAPVGQTGGEGSPVAFGDGGAASIETAPNKASSVLLAGVERAEAAAEALVASRIAGGDVVDSLTLEGLSGPVLPDVTGLIAKAQEKGMAGQSEESAVAGAEGAVRQIFRPGTLADDLALAVVDRRPQPRGGLGESRATHATVPIPEPATAVPPGATMPPKDSAAPTEAAPPDHTAVAPVAQTELVDQAAVPPAKVIQGWMETPGTTVKGADPVVERLAEVPDLLSGFARGGAEPRSAAPEISDVRPKGPAAALTRPSPDAWQDLAAPGPDLPATPKVPNTALRMPAAATFASQPPAGLPEPSIARLAAPSVAETEADLPPPLPLELPPATAGFWERLLTGLAAGQAVETRAPGQDAVGPVALSQDLALIASEPVVDASSYDLGAKVGTTGAGKPAEAGSPDAARMLPGKTTMPPRPPAAWAAMPILDLIADAIDEASDDPALALTSPVAAGLPGAPVSGAGVAPAAFPIPQVAAQIAVSLSQSGDGATELALSPEELGHVRLRLEPDAANPDRMVVMISFERPETLDLFRRHAGELAEAIRSAGYSGADIGFGQHGSGSSPDRNEGSAGPTPRAPHDQSSPTPSAPGLVAGASLDLRL